MDVKCEKFIVSGIVQGVGFRYYTSHTGQKLGVTGYAKNLNNGDVEVVVAGNAEQIEMMAEWLKDGPRTASVTELIREPIAYKPFKGFKIL